MLLTLTPQVHAQPAAPAAASAGSSTLARARTTWDRGEFDIAETLYKEAIERGGLERPELIDAYVHLGACRAVIGRKDLALAAFRNAALVDPRFVVPAEAGRKAVVLAEKARREAAKIGVIELRMTVPTSTPGAEIFHVDATLDIAHTAIVSRVGIEVREPVSGASYAGAQTAAPEMRFDVPPRVVIGDSIVVVRTFALDGHDNKLAVVEQKVRVEAVPLDKQPVASKPVVAPRKSAPAEPEPKKSFWQSPWPYVVGGVALAAGSAALYVGTRPSDDVSIGAVRVQAR